MLSGDARGPLLALLAAATAVSASNVVAPRCTTISGYQKVYNVPTKSTTTCVTTTKKVTVTSTPTVTVTGSAPKSTTTLLSTVVLSSIAPQVIDTVTITQTDLATITTEAPTSTYFSTVLETSTTTSVGVYTVPTVNGFLPAASTIPKTNKSYKKRELGLDAQLAPRKAKSGGSLVARDEITYQDNGIPVIHRGPGNTLDKRGSYPQSVVCQYTSTKTVTSTVKTTCKAVTKTASASPVTVTTTKIVSTTRVSVPVHATTTVTTTSISTSTAATTPSTTSVVTSTVVETSVSATSTVYAACASGSGNQVWAVNSAYIETVRGGSGNSGTGSVKQTSDNTPYDCCAACFQNPACTVSALLPYFGCYLLLADGGAGVCTAPNLFGASVVVDRPGTESEGSYVVSNGNCGQYNVVENGFTD